MRPSGSTRAIKEEVDLLVSNGAQATGISDSRYDLVSVLYHALEDGYTHAKYIEDAGRGSDQELADTFKEVQRQDAERGKKAKESLDERYVVAHKREGRIPSSSKQVPMDATVRSKDLVRDRFRAVIPVRIVEISEERRALIPNRGLRARNPLSEQILTLPLA
jgi:hypothetical protein